MFPNYPGGRVAYQDFVVRQLQDYYASPIQLPSGLLDIAEQLWQKDLTGVNILTQDVYSTFEPSPRSACCMLRSYLLSIVLHFSVAKLGRLDADGAGIRHPKRFCVWRYT